MSGRSVRNTNQGLDRSKTTPLYLRIFVRVGGHHTAEEFNADVLPIRDELQIYTWKNASLRELSQLIGGAKKAGRARDAILSFAFVYPDKTGKNVVRKVGETQNNLQNSETDMKTLAELKFETGDYLDVAILPAKEE